MALGRWFRARLRDRSTPPPTLRFARAPSRSRNALNTWRHLEVWYGILGIGAIYHTVNPRLFADQIVWIINHAEDRFVVADLTFLPLLEKLADRLPTVERYIVLTDAANMPPTTLRNAVAYEAWIA